MKACEREGYFMRKTAILSALTACVILSGTQITGLAKEIPQFTTKTYTVYKSWCNGIQKPPAQKPETEAPEIEIPEIEVPEVEAPETDSNSAFASEVLSLVNAERAKNGLSALTLASDLSSVAQKHSEDMAKNNYFSHTSLSGKSPFDRIKDAGISYRTAAENIAAGQKTPSEVVKGWMNSEGHRKNILNASFTKMGLGYATSNSGYKTYWTQVFTG